MSEPGTAPAEKAPADARRESGPARKRRGAVVYIGPNRPYGLPLMQNQIFTGNVPPPFAQSLCREKPHFAACFISTANLGAALSDRKDPRSAISLAVAGVGEETLEARTLAGGN